MTTRKAKATANANVLEVVGCWQKQLRIVG
jgi:hypothetical protein